MAETLFRHADLQVGLLETGATGFVSGKSFDETEVALFRRGAPGIVTAVRQAEGQQVGTFMAENLEGVEDPAVIEHVATFEGMGLLGASWESFAKQAPKEFGNPIDRRRLHLPSLATGDPETPPTLDGLLSMTIEIMHQGVTETQLLMGAMMRAPYMTERMKKKIGLTLGNAALKFAALGAPNGLKRFGATVTDYDAQYFAKQRAQWLKEQTVRFGVREGVNPSIAQFAPANRDSRLAVAFRTAAPNKQALEIYDSAISRNILGIRQFAQN